MDITPHPNLLKSLRGECIDYIMLVGEGIDNAFDAGANTIEVGIADDEIRFEDDGNGVTRDRIGAVFSLGEHGPMTTTALGRFGIGIKSQAVNAGNVFEIDSVSVDGRVRLSVDWRKVLKSGQWTIDDPRWAPVIVGKNTGTVITISDLRTTRSPPGGWVAKIVNDAAERFYPAVAVGQRISVNGQWVPLIPEPRMTDVVERQLSLSNGRSAHLRAGILAQASKLNRVHVAYKHRVIMPASTVGCGESGGGLTKMFARLRLAGPWHFAKFKNNLTDEDEREELEDAVADVLRPILEKCSAASFSAKIDEISRLINEKIPPEFMPARPRKQKESGTGPKKKGQQQGTVATERSDPFGPARSKRYPRNELRITFDGVVEQDGIGAFQAGRPHRVNLSKEHPLIASLIEHRDQAVGIDALLGLAFALFEQARETELPAPELPFDPFGKRIARLFGMQDSPKGRMIENP